MINLISIMAEMIVREFDNNSTLVISTSNDGSWTTIGAVVIGGFITMFANFIQEKIKSKNEKKKQQQEEEERLHELRNSAYIETSASLSLLSSDIEYKKFGLEWNVHKSRFAESSSKVFAYGSSEIKKEVYDLFRNLSNDGKIDFDKTKNKISKLSEDIANELMSKD